ncbi:hypothetical protein [Listeria monocytogenes]|uniref:hypothetical protein n=1 Tax=Listeria monocytogenes TaxID=1639 RepID=UPI000C1F7FC8|nr:hypothetical protein [Listeria monocytogenes]EAD0970078.1 hypothetical protein [Listeria monocytogenes]EAD0973404.1 hypothetical protein [Listeria monocytogenes]EAE2197751.1 hypothetical protein [Listeria monocytogenes]EAE2219297.1 hypothetical protein [Listeria monocytogenes]EAE2228766.1 hypothetical protein [Listeria monocytogenes]
MNKRYLKTRKTDSNDRFAFIVDERGFKSVFLNGSKIDRYVNTVDIIGNKALEKSEISLHLLI